jgi:hypothetical protein
MLTAGLLGCGSSSSPTTTPDANALVPDAGGRDSAGKADLPAPNAPDAWAAPDTVAVPVADGSLGDTAASEQADTAVGDRVGSPSDAVSLGPDGTMAPDAQLGADMLVAADALSAPDGPPVPDTQRVFDTRPTSEVAKSDSAIPSATDGGSVVSSTTTPDNPTEPTICSTVLLGERDLLADQTYDIVMPDCLRVSGTITLASPLPDGAVYSGGSVQLFKLIRDTNGTLTDNVVYDGVITPVDDTHFRYSVGVPADTYEVMYTFITKSSAPPSLTNLPSTASRIGQDRLTVEGSITHDVTLPAISVTTRTVTVTGTDALPSHANQFGRYLIVYQVNTANTLLVMGMSMTAGPLVPISMWVPNETFTPTLTVQDSPGVGTSGFLSQFKLAPVTPSGDFSLAMPPAVQISGTISDPNNTLSRIPSPTGQATSPVNYYQCNSLDYGSFPDPIFMFPEANTSQFFVGTTSHTLFVRSGIDCVTYANYAIAIGPGGLPTRDGENTYVYIDDPSRRSPDAVVLTTDVVRDIEVPALDTQVTMRGTVRDARGNPVPYAELRFNSDAMTSPAWANKTFNGGLDVGSTGSYVAHALPGRYRLSIELSTSSSAGTVPDASVPGGGPDASYTLPDVSFTLPDVSFTLPDLPAITGDCSTLAACCPQLGGSSRTGCESIVSLGTATTCASYLAVLRLGGSCS